MGYPHDLPQKGLLDSWAAIPINIIVMLAGGALVFGEDFFHLSYFDVVRFWWVAVAGLAVEIALGLVVTRDRVATATSWKSKPPTSRMLKISIVATSSWWLVFALLSAIYAAW